MKQKAVDWQLSLFGQITGATVTSEEDIEEAVEAWERTRVITPTFSKATERDIGLFIDLMVWAMSTQNIVAKRGRCGLGERFNDLEPRHHMDIVVERFITIKKLLDEWKALDERALQQAEYEAQYTAMVNRWKAQRARLTNREVCLMLCDLSLEAPLASDAAAEYMRAFAFSYGLKRYAEVFGDDEAPFLSFDHCYQMRHGPFKRVLPLINEGEIDAFNAELRLLRDRAQRKEMVTNVAVKA